MMEQCHPTFVGAGSSRPSDLTGSLPLDEGRGDPASANVADGKHQSTCALRRNHRTRERYDGNWEDAFPQQRHDVDREACETTMWVKKGGAVYETIDSV